MITFPNAKINIGLNITEKRADGFHNIVSCFYPVGWKDALEIIPSNELSFTSSGISIPGNGNDNLCLQAYKLLKKDFDISPVSIHLHKNIPIGAGLGGGSADCAFTIKMLNEMFSLNLSVQQMENYAAQLGSDCPFFIENKPMFVTGRGEVFSPLNISLKDKYIVLVNPQIHISTKEAYSGVIPKQPEKPLESYLLKDITDWKGNIKNDFEDSILPNHPKIETLKEQFYNEGALYASMTGSGSSVFGIFEEEPSIDFEEGLVDWKGRLD